MRQLVFALVLCGVAQAQEVKPPTITMEEVSRCFGNDRAFVQRFAAYETARATAQREIDALNRGNAALEEQHALVESDRLAVKKLADAYEPIDQDLNARQKKLDAMRAKDSMTQQDVNTYNRLIREFNRVAQDGNAQLEELKRAQAAFNQRVDAFNGAVDAHQAGVAAFKTKNAAFLAEADNLQAEFDAHHGQCAGQRQPKGESR